MLASTPSRPQQVSYHIRTGRARCSDSVYITPTVMVASNRRVLCNISGKFSRTANPTHE